MGDKEPPQWPWLVAGLCLLCVAVVLYFVLSVVGAMSHSPSSGEMPCLTVCIGARCVLLSLSCYLPATSEAVPGVHRVSVRNVVILCTVFPVTVAPECSTL